MKWSEIQTRVFMIVGFAALLLVNLKHLFTAAYYKSFLSKFSSRGSTIIKASLISNKDLKNLNRSSSLSFREISEQTKTTITTTNLDQLEILCTCWRWKCKVSKEKIWTIGSALSTVLFGTRVLIGPGPVCLPVGWNPDPTQPLAWVS